MRNLHSTQHTDVVLALSVPTEDKRSRFNDIMYFKCYNLKMKNKLS